MLNAEKSAADTHPPVDNEAPTGEESLILSYRQKKNRALRLISLQTAAFLNWDLDLLAKLVAISVVNLAMKYFCLILGC